MMKLSGHRKQSLWFAFIMHRISGLVLALFLPLHFWVLSLAGSGKKGEKA